MTQQAADIYGTAFKGGTVTLMARILGNDGTPLVPSDLGAITYSVYLLDDQDADARQAVAGHDGAPLAVGDVVFGTLQTGPPWDADADADGYNFRHTPDVSSHPALPVADRRYLVEYRLIPQAGQVVIARFRINAI